jgi:hypothetical protein
MSASETASASANPANLILALLAPMFLWSTSGDIRLAYTAAAQTVNEYRITNRLSLFTVAKIIAFDIATLSSLSLSMHEDVSMLLALRLRGNANSLDRSGERNRRLLEQESRAGDASDASVIEAAIAEAERMVREANSPIHAAAPEPKQPNAEPAPAPAPETPPAPAPAGQPQAARADAITAVPEVITASLDDLPQDKRWKEIARSNALTKAPADLASRAAPPPIPAMAAA